MVILKRKQCIYYIREESIILEYNHQYTSYNVYSLQNRKRFKDFKQTLLTSAPHEYDNITDIISLAIKYGLRGSVGNKPVIDEFDIYQ